MDSYWDSPESKWATFFTIFVLVAGAVVAFLVR